MRRQTASASISRLSARQRSTCTSASLIDMKPAFAGAVASSFIAGSIPWGCAGGQEAAGRAETAGHGNGLPRLLSARSN
jgi:hypothetical protein